MGCRRCSADDRARILEETLAPGAVVSAVAPRHDLTPQQLFTWLRWCARRWAPIRSLARSTSSGQIAPTGSNSSTSTAPACVCWRSV
ncbi:transposase [Tianweitania sp. Rool2]|uniref:Transposase n=1 Tax=Oryzicola mucosus TaxID=2767425 RepID=A0A8J6PLT3_9HYPH|nr:transposase [Oryzicola mucosus]